jgi:hypothetical protein
MNEINFIKIFIQHLLYDKSFAEAFVERFPRMAETLGEYINKKWKEELYIAKGKKSIEEFVDFIDGNGFIINRSNPNYISILIIYEEPKHEKKKSHISMDFSVQTTVLYNSSVEDYKRYILEYQKFLASWTFWLRVCRRVELLRMVPEGCGRSITIHGRPP